MQRRRKKFVCTSYHLGKRSDLPFLQHSCRWASLQSHCWFHRWTSACPKRSDSAFLSISCTCWCRICTFHWGFSQLQESWEEIIKNPQTTNKKPQPNNNKARVQLFPALVQSICLNLCSSCLFTLPLLWIKDIYLYHFHFGLITAHFLAISGCYLCLLSALCNCTYPEFSSTEENKQMLQLELFEWCISAEKAQSKPVRLHCIYLA